MRLVLNRSSVLCRYWVFIRQVWGVHHIPDHISLCKMFWTIVLGSAATLFFSPFMAIGWACILLASLAYRGVISIGSQRVVDALDRLAFSETLDKYNKYLATSPVFASLGISLIVTAIFLAIVAIILAIPDGLSELAREVGWLIAQAGFFAFYFFSVVGWIGYNVVSAFFRSETWYFIFGGLVFTTVTLFVSCTLVFLTHLFIVAIEKEIKPIYEKPERKEKPYRRSSTARIGYAIFDAIKSLVNWVKALFYTEVYVGGKKRTVIGPLGVLIETIWAFKQGVCPLIDIIEPKVIKDAEELLAQYNAMDAATRDKVGKRFDRWRLYRVYDVFVNQNRRKPPSKMKVYEDIIIYGDDTPLPIKVVGAKYILDQLSRENAKAELVRMGNQNNCNDIAEYRDPY
ncbi:MAG: hypothetical protein HC888_02600 [Candidatus Competibacteraceae bacterium]|nr:hypothetical protein [Candidatus Competibacteraceae bacterium]